MTKHSAAEKKLFALLTLGVLVHLPLLWGMGKRLWSEAHYQHFPLVVLAAIGLAYSRWDEVREILGATWSLWSAPILAIQLPLLAFAYAAGSHWLGAVSFLLYLLAVVLLCGGVPALRAWGGSAVLLALCIPLPLQQDVALVTSLQKIAAGFASGGLDLVGVRHRLQGVAIHVPGKTYFVEEACSGVNSLFSSIAFIAFYLLYRRHHWLRFLVGLIQVCLWVILINAARVFLVVYCEQRYGVDLSEGWLHQALGGAAFAVIILLAISGDYLVLALVPARPFTLGPAPQPPAPPPRAAFGGFALSLVAALVMLSAAVGVSLSMVRAAEPAAGQSAVAIIRGISEDTLPESVGPWRRLEFWTESRDAGDLQGAASSIWRFRRGALQVLFSIDGPFPDWHDLAYCYSSLDWKLIDAENTPLPRGGAEHSAAEPCTQLEFFTDQQQRAIVFFTCYDADNQPVQPLDPSGHLLRRLWDRLVSANPFGRNLRLDVKAPVIQAQMQVVTDDPLLEGERAELEELFDQLRRLARRGVSPVRQAAVEQAGGAT